MLEAALDYAARGWAVHPLKPRGKEPLTAHGHKDATTDPEQIKAWWNDTPTANIGIACGPASGILVLDFDPRNAADEDDYTRIQRRCIEAQTLTAATGGGGYHYVFKMPEDVRTNGTLGSGIDVKAKGYIVAPPSVHPSGGVYGWANNAEVADLPESLAGLVIRDESPEHHERVDDPNDTRPGTQFNREASWEDVLGPHGWELVDTAGEEEFWRRPGKTTGFSATTNYEGSGLLYTFTTSTEFEANRGYDKVGAYAVLNHGGDVDAALEELKELWTGPTMNIVFDQPKKVEVKYEPYKSPLPDDHFVSAYVRYASEQTDASPEYHEACALTLLATATAPARVALAPYPGGLHTNLYLVLVGSTTRSRKSTAQNIATDISDAIAPYATLPSRITTEALVHELAGTGGLARLWTPDEFGMMIAEVGRRDFLRGVEELLLTVYGGKDYVYTTMRDTVTIKNPHLSVLGAATQESLALAGPTAMLGGLLPRFGIVFPGGAEPPRAPSMVEGLADKRRAVVHKLRAVQQYVTDNPKVTMTEGAIAVLSKAENEYVDKGAHIARLPMMLYKVAALNALAAGTNVVQADMAAAAVVMVDRWRAGADRLQPYLRRKAVDIEFDRLMFSALDALKELGGEAHRSQVARKVGVTKSKMDTVQATLVDQGYITVTLSTGMWKVK